MFANFTWKKVLRCISLAAMLVIIGVCLDKAERSQVGSQHIASAWMFIMASLIAAYGALVAAYLALKAWRHRKQTEKAENDGNS